jgi:hypothetical protein
VTSIFMKDTPLCFIKMCFLTLWSRILETPTGPGVVKKFPAFMETGSSLRHSQEPATYSYLEPDRSSPLPTLPPPTKIDFNIIHLSTLQHFRLYYFLHMTDPVSHPQKQQTCLCFILYIFGFILKYLNCSTLSKDLLLVLML